MVDSENIIPYGYCQCGCGQQTKIAPKNRPDRGWVKGEPIRFIIHHQPQMQTNSRPWLYEIPKGLCQCGCGQKTKIADQSRTARGWIKGQPKQFIAGHFRLPNLNGKNNPSWKRGYTISHGYIILTLPEHPRADAKGRIREHILIAEKAFGKALPNGAEVHHINGKKNDNKNNNLIICQDHTYHMLIDKRSRAYYVCGNADWVKCPYCKKYDAQENMMIFKGQTSAAHRDCRNRAKQQWHKEKKTHHATSPVSSLPVTTPLCLCCKNIF